MSNTKRAVSGIIWSAIDRFSIQGVQFVLSFIIARQLCPSDYGLIAMLSVFMAIAQTFIDSGFANSLIQKQDRDQKDYSTVFYFNIVVSVVAYVCLVIISPFISTFYNQPILENITVWLGLNLIIGSFATVQRAILTVELKFKNQAVISLVSVIISGVIAVYMAYSGYAVWTLVVQTLICSVINVILLWITTKWYPSLIFSFQSFKQLFAFGSRMLGVGLIHTIFQNLYNIIIGRIYTSNELGLYNRASTLSQYPSNNISHIVNRVVYPIFCTQSDNDVLLKSTFVKTIRHTMIIVLPLMMLLYVFSESLIICVLTEKWIKVVPLLRILCIAYSFNPITNLMAYIFMAKGMTKYNLISEILKKSVFFIIIIYTKSIGLSAMCLGLIVYSLFDYVIMLYFVNKLIKISTFEIIKCIFPAIYISLIIGVISYVSTITFTLPLVKILIGGTLSLVAYLCYMIITKYDGISLVKAYIKK